MTTSLFYNLQVLRGVILSVLFVFTSPQLSYNYTMVLYETYHAFSFSHTHFRSESESERPLLPHRVSTPGGRAHHLKTKQALKQAKTI